MKNKKVKKTSIGGQAVIEGVMMRGPSSMATAVRDSDGIIRLETKRVTPTAKKNIFFRFPIIRGVVAFVASLFGGIEVLMRSAEVFGEGEPSKFEKWLAEKLKVNVMGLVSVISVILALIIAIVLFIFLPSQITKWCLGENPNVWAKNFIEGGIKIGIFVLYILFCMLFKDVRRTFMYHGAEHKTISCYEKGLPLTTENAKKCSRLHDRCGTTFIFFVLFLSIIIFAIFESLVGGVLNNVFIRTLCKIALLPIVAGVSYELLKGLAKTDCFIFFPLKAPGLLLQKLLTTREPDEKMIEVAISAFNEVMLLEEDENRKTVKFTPSKKRKDLTEKIYTELYNNGIKEKAEAEWIVSLTLNIKRDEVYSDDLVSPSKVEKINKIVDERITGRPLWYCIGNADFYGYTVKVDERVLIPRPETEILVENAKKVIKEESKVLDLCTGSGAIAIAVKKETNATVFASDISVDALTLAKENASDNQAEIEFIESDLFSNIEGKFDVIISNPPYIKTEDINTLQKEVKDFEPKLALDGGINGFDFYIKIAKDVKKYLTEKGVLLLECGIGQAEEISKMLKGFSSVEIIKDLENIDRVIKAVK